MAKRQGLSKRVRFAVFARDAFTCRYCGRQSDQVTLVVDHVIPVAKGGTSDESNLVTACEPCNQGKADRLLEQAAPTDGSRLRMQQEAREQVRAAEMAMEAVAARREFRDAVVDLWCDIRGQEGMHTTTLNVMCHFAEQHGFDHLARWIEIAHMKKPWAADYQIGRYVSGIRRRMLDNGELD